MYFEGWYDGIDRIVGISCLFENFGQDISYESSRSCGIGGRFVVSND